MAESWGGVLILAHIGAITRNKCQSAFVKAVCEIKKRGLPVVGMIIGDVITDADREYVGLIRRGQRRIRHLVQMSDAA